MENQTEKSIDNELETRCIQGLCGISHVRVQSTIITYFRVPGPYTGNHYVGFGECVSIA